MAGNAVIGALRVNLGIDTAQFSEGLQKAQSSLSKVGAMMKTAFVAAAAAAAAAIAGIGLALKGMINDADDMSKAASKIGIPIEELSKLRYAADMSGVSMEGLQTGVRKLSQGMLAFVQKGTGPAADAFKRLGIEVKNSDGSLRSSTDVMGQIADRFAAMPDGVQKTALAVQLFGKAGTDMIPMLNGGSAALKQMTDEAEQFGLVISEETGKRAEAFNDNLSRLSYAGQGLTTMLMAALLPALVTITDGIVAAVKGLGSMLEYLPVVAEYAAVAGSALGLMMSPMIISGILAGAQAIGVVLVGAIHTVTAAMAANPLGALVVGITLAITAAYHFRDEISQAIGVDVVQVTKDAANATIGAFVGAYEGIKAAWSGLPSALGAIVIGTANTVIKGMESMVNRAVEKINGFIQTVNTLVASLPFGAGEGIQIGAVGAVDFGEITNVYAAKAKEAADAFNGAFAAAQKDYFAGSGGEAIATGLRSATDAADDLSNALAGGSGGGGGKKGKGKKAGVSDAAKAAKKSLEDMNAEGKRIFEQTRTPAEQLQARLDRLSELLKSGAIDWETYSRAVKMAQEDMAGAGKGMTTLGDIGETIGQSISGAFQGLVDGSKKIKDVLLDLTGQLSSMLLNNGFKSLFSGLGGGGGFLGSLFGGGFKSTPGGFGAMLGLPGFANGGSFNVGGSGGIDSQLVAFRASPSENVSITKPGQERSGGAMAVHVVPSPYFDVHVERIADNTAQTRVAQGQQQAQRTFPGMQADRTRRYG
jgi:hypothetical protein